MDTLALEMQFSDLVKRFINENRVCYCPVTKLRVDNNPSDNGWLHPTAVNGEIMSWLGRAIINSEITADELTNAVDYLRQREK